MVQNSPRKQQSIKQPDLTMKASEHSIIILQHRISSVLNKRNTVGCISQSAGIVEEVSVHFFRGANPNLIAELNQFRGTLLHATSDVEIAKELISYGAIVVCVCVMPETYLVKHHCIGLQ
ncbi:hypothetical protein TNCV_1994041 [Trichonephila clavipes]|nr:hypothetical protein TNCV_1994041 [Trichonephila clavipes]